MMAHGMDKIVFSSTVATYGEAKLSIEKMMAWTSRAHGLRYVALRYFNACGAHLSGMIGEAHDPETHLIPVILQVPNGQQEKLSIFGGDYPTKDGTCVRDFIHITDLAQAHILALDYLLNGGKNNVFNLENGMGFTNKEVVDVARKVTGYPIPAEIAPRWAGDPAQLVTSSEKAKTILGWNPQCADLEVIVAYAWNWHRNRPPRLRKRGGGRMIDEAVSKLAAYAPQRGLIQPCEKSWAINTILDVLKIDSYYAPGRDWGEVELVSVLDELLDDAHSQDVLAENLSFTEICSTPGS